MLVIGQTLLRRHDFYTGSVKKQEKLINDVRNAL